MQPVNKRLTSTVEHLANVAGPGQAVPEMSAVVLERFSELDRLIYQEDEIFFLPRAKQQELMLKHLQEAFAWHYQSCQSYRSYCERLGFDPALLRTIKDLDRIPLIPTSVFKQRIVKSIRNNDVEKRCVSSGTLGTRSVIVRDAGTLERLLGSVRLGTKLIAEWYEDQVQVLNLGPSTLEAADIWFSYVMSLVNLLHQTRNYVRENIFRIEELLADLIRAEAETHSTVAVAGPPFLFARLSQHLEELGVSFHFKERMIVVTAGGWKHHSHESIQRNIFEQKLAHLLGLNSIAQVRDAFNQVELNTVFFECEYKRKHVPPWVYVSVRDPLTLNNLHEKGQGLLSYCDASATSYPCFILTDDVGRCLTEETCTCGRRGQTVEIIRRISTSETHGCAIKMNGLISVEEFQYDSSGR